MLICSMLVYLLPTVHHENSTKCRKICHTWILWDWMMNPMGLDDEPYGIGWWFPTGLDDESRLLLKRNAWSKWPFLSILRHFKTGWCSGSRECFMWLFNFSMHGLDLHRSSLRESETYQFPTKISHYTAKISLNKTIEDWNLTRGMYKNGRNWSSLKHSLIPHHNWGFRELLLMEKILHHLGCITPCKSWGKLPINWCKISANNRKKCVGIPSLQGGPLLAINGVITYNPYK